MNLADVPVKPPTPFRPDQDPAVSAESPDGGGFFAARTTSGATVHQISTQELFHLRTQSNELLRLILDIHDRV
jgi:hypothetical protein